MVSLRLCSERNWRFVFNASQAAKADPRLLNTPNVVNVFSDVQRFPSLERERERQERERADSGSSAERRTPARLHDPNHNREVIFSLPTMELFFKTEHLQAVGTPESTGMSRTQDSIWSRYTWTWYHIPCCPLSIIESRPVVECSFITEFGDHIFVTVDAEAFFFLHDLIISYIKEKEKLVSKESCFFNFSRFQVSKQKQTVPISSLILSFRLSRSQLSWRQEGARAPTFLRRSEVTRKEPSTQQQLHLMVCLERSYQNSTSVISPELQIPPPVLSP